MDIRINKEVSFDLFRRLEFIDSFSRFLRMDFALKSFGESVKSLCIVLNSIDPEMGIDQDFDTGVVIHKKYIKSKKYLELHYKLNHRQLTFSNTENEILGIVRNGLQNALNQVGDLNINDFDTEKLNAEFATVVAHYLRSEKKADHTIYNYDANELSEHHTVDDMGEKVFWEIIEQSKDERDSYKNQIQILIDKLYSLDEKSIVGFEYTLRDILEKSAHYNILAASRIIHGIVSDDHFLYLRCRLILEGRDFYFSVIDNPQIIAESGIQDIEFGGEEVLSIADRAFIMKFGETTDKELPRSIAGGYLNYDELDTIKGDVWKEEELSSKYPQLWNCYHT